MNIYRTVEFLSGWWHATYLYTFIILSHNGNITICVSSSWEVAMIVLGLKCIAVHHPCIYVKSMNKEVT